MDYRCGKHVVIANPASPISIWVECAVHRSDTAQVGDRFRRIVGLDFRGEEKLHLNLIVKHCMLD
jgi:hypothetical protein